MFWRTKYRVKNPESSLITSDKTPPYRIVSTLSVGSCLAVGDGCGSLHGAADAINDGVAAAPDTRGHTRRMR